VRYGVEEEESLCSVTKDEVENEKEDTSLMNKDQATGRGCVIIGSDALVTAIALVNYQPAKGGAARPPTACQAN
jgi:hypothetical protein